MSDPQIDYYLNNKETFYKVGLRVLNILWQASPKKMTVEEIREKYKETYHHSALIGNRLRDLRKDGEVVSEWDAGRKRKLWTVSGKWRKPNKK
jgi:DNA-binding PadR family transcriptional regulator